MTFLVTSWFGCFRFTENKILDEYVLFKKDPETIAKKLTEISKHQILPEEKTLTTNKSDIIVNQKRLSKIGRYEPSHAFFKKAASQINHFAYPMDILQKATIIHGEQLINEKLSLPDFQIIQKVHAIDDLYHAINVFDERIESWKVFSIDSQNLSRFQQLKQQMTQEVQQLQEEIKKHIQQLAPNTSILIGPMLTARLLVHAGSLEKLARLPASSIQLLGAEKALFRFKKEGGKPPKHGILFQHESLLKASKNKKGQIARLLSLKIILAIRADVYTKRNMGMKLKQEFEEQIQNISKRKTKKENQHKHK
jgi:nucleolar protein 56